MNTLWPKKIFRETKSSTECKIMQVSTVSKLEEFKHFRNE